MSGLVFRFVIECTNFVAVEISNIGITYVTALFAWAGGAFIGATEAEGEGVQPVHLRLVLRLQRDHDAVADGHRLAIEREGDADTGGAVRDSPGDGLVCREHARRAEFGGERIVEDSGLFEVARAECNLSDHCFVLLAE